MGEASIPDTKQELEKISFPKIGTSGFFNKILFLPENSPRVVAWEVFWLNDEVSSLQKEIRKEDSWLPHVSICRGPFDQNAWSQAFKKLPCYAKALHLYQSLGNSTYKSLWNTSFIPPFEEIHHTADIAFKVHGKDFDQIYQNAFTALAFKDSNFLDLYAEKRGFSSLDQVIIALNELVCSSDSLHGCPFKAVSFYGKTQSFEHGIYWEMIVDV